MSICSATADMSFYNFWVYKESSAKQGRLLADAICTGLITRNPYTVVTVLSKKHFVFNHLQFSLSPLCIPLVSFSIYSNLKVLE